MGKFGVGVGEDFPLDDGNGDGRGPGQDGPRDDRAEFEDWKRRRDAHQAQRDAWRAHREEWRRNRQDWHQAKHEFKDRLRRTLHENFHDDDHGPRSRGFHRHWGFWPFGLALLAIAVPVLIIALFFSLISAAFKAPFVMLAIVAILFASFAFRHRFHRHGWHHRYYGRRDYGYGRDYDVDVKPRPQPPQNDAAQPPPDNAK